MKNIKYLFCLFFLTSCLVGCGSAKAIKGYRYKTTKYTLEKAVVKVINTNTHIQLDTTEEKVRVLRYPDRGDDTITLLITASQLRGSDDRTNVEYVDYRDKAYTKITIKKGQKEVYYVFRYLGNEQHWETSPNSAIFISLVQDKQGNSLHQGHNEKGQFRSKLAKDFTDLFETEVVHKIDKELNLKHKVD